MDGHEHLDDIVATLRNLAPEIRAQWFASLLSDDDFRSAIERAASESVPPSTATQRPLISETTSPGLNVNRPDPESSISRTPSIEIDGYTLGDEIGRGGMSTLG